MRNVAPLTKPRRGGTRLAGATRDDCRCVAASLAAATGGGPAPPDWWARAAFAGSPFASSKALSNQTGGRTPRGCPRRGGVRQARSAEAAAARNHDGPDAPASFPRLRPAPLRLPRFCFLFCLRRRCIQPPVGGAVHLRNLAGGSGVTLQAGAAAARLRRCKVTQA